MNTRNCLIAYAALLAGCGTAPTTGGPSGAEGDDEQEPAEAEGDGDGDGDGEPAVEYCDVSAFPQIEPEWIVETPGATPNVSPAVAQLAIGASVVYVTGSNDLSNSHGDGFIECLGLDGTLQWNNQIPEFDFPIGRLQWDGTHVYAQFDDDVLRWSSDGTNDNWVVGRENLVDWEVSDEGVAMVGEFVAQWDDPMFYDAFVTGYDKSLPPNVQWDETIGELDAQDGGVAIAAMASGGWVAGVTTGTSLWLHGYGGAVFDAKILPSQFKEMFGRGDHVLLAGSQQQGSGPRSNLMTAVSSSQELWRRTPKVCTANEGITRITMQEDRLVAWVSVEISEGAYQRVLVEFTPDAEVVKVSGVAIDGMQLAHDALALGEEGVFIGGSIKGEDIVPARFVAKVDF